MQLSYCLVCLFLSLSVSVHSQTLMFSQQPEAYYYVHTDVPLTIQCVSTGTSITYRRANSGVSTTTSNAAYTQSNPVFNVDASIGGVDWDCLAEDGSGNIVSSRARVFWSTFSDSSSSAGNPLQIELRNTVTSYLPCNFFSGSTPTPTVTWLRNGASFTANNLPGSNSLFLERTEITTNPTATYRCVLTNHLGGSGTAVQANREYQLRVSSSTSTFQAHYFPNTDITVTAGDTIYFECVGIGQSCVWEQFSNGVWGPLPDTAVEQYSGALTSYQITTESSTQYRATLGVEIQAPFTVTINESPDVVSSIQGMLVEYERQDISIYCESSGIPTPDITWYHNELLVQNQANKYTLTPAGNRSTLQIQTLANSDSGHYTCRADSVIGSDVVISRLSVRLAVPPTFIQNPTPNSITSVTNDMFIITCIASGDPAPDIIWTFTPKDTSDKQTIVANSKYSISTNKSIEAVPVQSTLTVSLFDSRDNGDYRCTATNFRSSLPSTISTVLIATDPVILTTFPNTSVVVMENAVVTQDCEVVGEPSPTVKWFSGSTEITEDTSVLTVFPNNTLRIDTTRLQSGTTYRCQAMNSGATVSSSFILVVQSCPRVVVTPTGPLNSPTQVNATLSCVVSGNPAPLSMWTYRSPGSDTPGDLPGTQNNVMEREENGVFKVDIIPITQNNQGEYCCEAYTQALESSCGASPQEMMCVDILYEASCADLYFCIFELWHLIVIIVGGFIIIVLIVCGVSCLIYLIYRSCQSNTYNINKAKAFNLPYKVKREDDSDDDGEFDPTYESLPANKATHPPTYKMAPYYNGGGTTSGPPPYNPPPMGDTAGIPLEGVMVAPQLAYPPDFDMHHSMPMMQDNFGQQPPEMYTTEFMNPELQMYPGEMVKGNPDEFLSTDGQFV